MNLEGDLGIDSIKRVEILSAVQEQAPELPEVDTATMAKLQTLGEIADYMQGLLGSPTSQQDAASEPIRAAVEDTPRGDLGRFPLEAIERPAIGMVLSGVFGAGRIGITTDGTNLAPALASALAERGVDAVVVDTESNAESDAESDAESNESSLNGAPLDAGLRGLIDLVGMRTVASVEEGVAINREAFQTARAFGNREGGLYVTVQDTGGAFGTTAFKPMRAWSAGPAALARTIDQEWESVSVKAIDLERQDLTSRDAGSAYCR